SISNYSQLPFVAAAVVADDEAVAVVVVVRHHHLHHDDQQIIRNSIEDDAGVISHVKHSSSHALLFSSSSELQGRRKNSDISQRGVVSRRGAPSDISALARNTPGNLNIEFGQLQHWVFPKDTTAVGDASSSAEESSEEEDIRFEKGDDDEWEGMDVVDLGDNDDKEDGREDGRTVYITLNTCLQPTTITTSSSANDGASAMPPPPLKVYISRSAENQRPGPDGPPDKQREVETKKGYAGIKINSVSTDIHIGVFAPNLTNGGDGVKYEGIYNYEITAAINRPDHVFDGRTPNLFLIDTDTTSALFTTEKLVLSNTNNNNGDVKMLDDHQQQELLDSIILVAQVINPNTSSSTTTNGLENSHCSLPNTQTNKNIDERIQTTTTLNRSTPLNNLRIQIHLTSLTPNTTYTAQLLLTSPSSRSSRRQTTLFSPLTITTAASTSSSSSCTLLHSLSFCTAIAYAVPSNPDTHQTLSDLRSTYDQHASSLYQNFSYALAQIPCETTPSARYSLAASCDDCAAAYKAWLCAVSIPRCFTGDAAGVAVEDQTAKEEEKKKKTTWLRERRPGQSRNEMVDRVIRPETYTEVLPCAELCWDLVRACPAELGFECPRGVAGVEGWYYDDVDDDDDDDVRRAGKGEGEGKGTGRCNNYVGDLGT
ncbi:MAG: stretch-activated cation channel mid1, partial [Peltula sp. TS41687]